MPVNGIDHVNIVTHDLEETAGFYAAVLGLERGETPVAAMGFSGAWMFDAQGQAIVHLVGYDPARHGDRHRADAPNTGPVDHVALRCTGFTATLARLGELGLEHRVNDRKYAGLRQVFVTDPNRVSLELNFSAD
jgi:catechol 2,3-dioxygenase-like lactoylglutathione lyase family enzyme